MCLKQVVDKKAQSWAPEWMPYTIIGDENWRDYEVSADVCLEQAGWAGVMGRVNNTGSGFGCVPRAYYMRLGSDGKCGLYAATQEKDAIDGKELAETDLAGDSGRQWHNLKMQFAGHTITGVVDGAKVLTVTNSLYASGMAGLVTGGAGTNRNTALFGNLIVKAVGATMPPPTVFAQDQSPIYTHEH
jgi:galactosylceramidase